jgi:hypothetical protein
MTPLAMIPLSMTRLYDFACAKRRAISAPVAFHTPACPQICASAASTGWGTPVR